MEAVKTKAGHRSFLDGKQQMSKKNEEQRQKHNNASIEDSDRFVCHLIMCGDVTVNHFSYDTHSLARLSCQSPDFGQVTFLECKVSTVYQTVTVSNFDGEKRNTQYRKKNELDMMEVPNYWPIIFINKRSVW